MIIVCTIMQTRARDFFYCCFEARPSERIGGLFLRLSIQTGSNRGNYGKGTLRRPLYPAPLAGVPHIALRGGAEKALTSGRPSPHQRPWPKGLGGASHFVGVSREAKI